MKIPEKLLAETMLNVLYESEKIDELLSQNDTNSKADLVKQWNDLFDQAIEIYCGPDHAKAHKKLLENLNKLKYETVISLWLKFQGSLTEDLLELKVRILANIMEYNDWDGTDAMLEKSIEEWAAKDNYLNGNIIGNYASDSETPPQIIYTLKKYLGENPRIVRATLATIYSWVRGNPPDETDKFIQELIVFAKNSSDEVVKIQVSEITTYLEEVKNLDLKKYLEDRLS